MEIYKPEYRRCTIDWCEEYLDTGENNQHKKIWIEKVDGEEPSSAFIRDGDKPSSWKRDAIEEYIAYMEKVYWVLISFSTFQVETKYREWMSDTGKRVETTHLYKSHAIFRTRFPVDLTDHNGIVGLIKGLEKKITEMDRGLEEKITEMNKDILENL